MQRVLFDRSVSTAPGHIRLEEWCLYSHSSGLQQHQVSLLLDSFFSNIHAHDAATGVACLGEPYILEEALILQPHHYAHVGCDYLDSVAQLRKLQVPAEAEVPVAIQAIKYMLLPRL